MSDVTFGEKVHLLKNTFPDINIPDSFYKTKKLIRALDYDYRRLMRAKMIVCCSESKTKTWMLVRYAMSLVENLVRLLC